MCIAGVVKNLNFKVVNLMSRTNKTRHIEGHETCKCKCEFGASVCNNKQHWNNDKYKRKYKELIDKGVCDKGSIWNPIKSECERDKSCDVGEYLDNENCKCWKKIVDKLIEQCTETTEEVKIANIALGADENKHKCSSCTLYIVFFAIIFTFSVGIANYFVYSHWYFKKGCYSC